jgi:hypothetical protein
MLAFSPIAPPPAPPSLTLLDLCELAEKVNENLELMVKPMMEKLEKELENGKLFVPHFAAPH